MVLSGDDPDSSLMKPMVPMTPAPSPVRVTRNLNGVKNLYLQARQGTVKCKDFRALQRSEAWDMAELYRRKFDRLLTGNLKKKAEEQKQAQIELANVNTAMLVLQQRQDAYTRDHGAAEQEQARLRAEWERRERALAEEREQTRKHWEDEAARLEQMKRSLDNDKQA